MAEKIENAEEINLEETFESQEIDSKYRKIILAAQRSKQLQRGATPRIDMDLKRHKPTRIAMKELEAGLINFRTTREMPAH
ncbi:MAG: DNA-directed RNA polymerase subunit omega [Pyrinomonadaceae bacterium]|nr:DNA-directed RNA polymerase subunit omega [Pyrinomonadaceae bacterium]